jgi:hypothetical protein
MGEANPAHGPPPSKFGGTMDWASIQQLLATIPLEIMNTIVMIAPPWVTLASLVTKFTPGESDNKYVDKILQALHTTALNPDAGVARNDTGFKQMAKNAVNK